jgi:alkylated DNA repair dioxygenase AlkB
VTLNHDHIGQGAWLHYDAAFLAPDEADALFAALRELVPWEERAIVVFGKEVVQPRLVSWYGDLPYRYSGQTLDPRPLPPVVAALNERVAALCGVPFNHIVLNLYRNGKDHVAMHCDAEPELGREPVIASLSLGARRKFIMRPKRRKFWKSMSLDHGSLLVMGGTCQHKWRHGVPKQPGSVGERINVTFRLLHGPPGWRQPRDVAPDEPTDGPLPLP